MSQPSTRPPLYKGYRFPPAIISHCVWLYFRFGVSLRDVSELMLARGVEVSHEAIRLWTLRFSMLRSADPDRTAAVKLARTPEGVSRRPKRWPSLIIWTRRGRSE